MNPYKILGVDENATIEEINKAYFELAKKHHPDINKNKESKIIMQEINAAYETLKNSEKRQQYDYFHNTNRAKYQDERARPKASMDHIQCQGCGVRDHTLRIVGFPYVISLLFVTFKRGWGGLYCSECRKNEMAKARLISLFLGWWGFPWGIFYTIANLFTVQGNIPREPNAEFLKYIGMLFLQNGELYYGRESLKASSQLKPDNYIDKLLSMPIFNNLAPKTKHIISKPYLFGFRLILIVGILIAILPNLFLQEQDAITPMPTNTAVASQNFISENSSSGTPRETDAFDQKTYTNLSYQFSVTYPADFKIEKSYDSVFIYSEYYLDDADYVIYQVFFDELDFYITSSDLDSEMISWVQEGLFENEGYRVISPLSKENIHGFPALSGVFSRNVEEIQTIEYSTIIFKENKIITLLVVGPDFVSDSIRTSYFEFKDGFFTF